MFECQLDIGNLESSHIWILIKKLHKASKFVQPRRRTFEPGALAGGLIPEFESSHPDDPVSCEPERRVPHAASAWPKVVILTWTTPVWVHTMFMSEPSAQTAQSLCMPWVILS